ncbi:MAG: S1-like domain-containing RNA-binding protein [Acholeplasmataceae bacterium]
MGLIVGKINQLTVNRKTDIGYMLETGQEEVFLHFNESNHEHLEPGQSVEAFLYFDQKGRLAATLTKPLLTKDTQAFLRVTDVVPQLGVFLDMGISKELLLSIDDLPDDFTQWPQVDDMIYSSLKIKNKFVAKIPLKSEIALKPKEALLLKSQVNAYVYRFQKEGIQLLTTDGHVIFVHQTQMERPYRLGEAVSVKVVYLSDQGYSGTLGIQKEVAMQQDALLIMAYLEKHERLPLTAQSSSEEIKAYFNMSRKAFKRALGTLYKAKKVDFIEHNTIIVK